MPTFKAIQEDLVTILAASGLSWCGTALASGTNLYAGGERPASEGFPPAGVWVLEYGGAAPRPYLNSARRAYVQGMAQILGRAEREQEHVGLADMRLIAGYLQQRNVTGIGYTALYVDQAAPSPFRLGEDDLYRWSLNVRMEYKAT